MKNRTILVTGAGGYAGECGHAPIAPTRVGTPPLEIPRYACGCGQVGCVDTVGAARGLERLHAHLTGDKLNSVEIVDAWCAGETAASRTVDVYFDVVAAMQPVNKARLVLWADAVANPTDDTRTRMVAADREFRDEIAKRIAVAVSAHQMPAGVEPHGLATVIVAMLRGVALQSLIDDHVDLDASRSEVKALLLHRLTTEQKDAPS